MHSTTCRLRASARNTHSTACRLRARKHCTPCTVLRAACGLVSTARDTPEHERVERLPTGACMRARYSAGAGGDMPHPNACDGCPDPRRPRPRARSAAARTCALTALRVLSIRGREVGRENLRGSNRVRAHLVSAGTRLLKIQVLSFRTRLTCSAPGPPNQLRIINSGTECLTVLRAH